VVDSTWWLQASICRGYDGNGICTLWYYDSIEIATTYYDTVGALTQEWEFVDARVMGSSHGVIRISGMAETGGPPPLTPAFPQGIDTLIWIYAQTNGPLGDSLCDSVDILTMFSRTETHFSNTYGEKIGCDYEWVVDTFYFNCAQWVGDTCVAWFDTIYDSIYACIIDTTRVILLGDTIDLVCCDWLPGDADYNGMYNIADVVYLIDYIFAAGAPPMPVVLAGDADCNGLVNVADIVHLISYIFGGGPVPWCTCEWLLEHYP
ncbi:MAG: hypothetical protein KAT58_04795, partial [candidate division Zixibacteria bacterium]|nr:hypothetical protein [candidate division Zixibacteria bacterium]